MSLLQFPRHVAVFVDRNGDYVGKKVIGYSFGALGQKKKTFEWNNGIYNIVPDKSSRLNFCFDSRIIWNDYIFVYLKDNGDPISFKNGHIKAIMNPEVYKDNLKTKLVHDVLVAGKGENKIPWRWIAIIGVGILTVVVMNSQGVFSGGA